MNVFFCEENKTIRCKVAFYWRTPNLPIWYWLSNELYPKTIRRVDLLSSDRIRFNLTSHLWCNGQPMDMIFFVGVIILAASWTIYGSKILLIFFTPAVFFRCSDKCKILIHFFIDSHCALNQLDFNFYHRSFLCEFLLQFLRSETKIW